MPDLILSLGNTERSIGKTPLTTLPPPIQQNKTRGNTTRDPHPAGNIHNSLLRPETHPIPRHGVETVCA